MRISILETATRININPSDPESYLILAPKFLEWVYKCTNLANESVSYAMAQKLHEFLIEIFGVSFYYCSRIL